MPRLGRPSHRSRVARTQPEAPGTPRPNGAALLTPRVVRALMIAELDVNPTSVRHVYLGVTRELREDLNETGACE